MRRLWGLTISPPPCAHFPVNKQILENRAIGLPNWQPVRLSLPALAALKKKKRVGDKQPAGLPSCQCWPFWALCGLLRRTTQLLGAALEAVSASTISKTELDFYYHKPQWTRDDHASTTSQARAKHFPWRPDKGLLWLDRLRLVEGQTFLHMWGLLCLVQTLLPSQLRDIILLCFPYILTLGPNEIFLFNGPLLPTSNTVVGLVTGKSIRWRAAAMATA